MDLDAMLIQFAKLKKQVEEIREKLGLAEKPAEAQNPHPQPVTEPPKQQPPVKEPEPEEEEPDEPEPEEEEEVEETHHARRGRPPAPKHKVHHRR